MKIAILGGSFDPPHLGHILIARQVLQYLNVDEVWLLPVASHAFSKNLSPSNKRMAMTRLLEEKKIKASDFEIKLSGVSITIKTLRKIKENFSKDEFTFIIGSDQLKDFKKWDEWENIIDEFGLIVFPREIAQDNLKNITLKALNLSKIPSKIKLLDSDELILTNLSSSKIRNRVKKRESIDYLVSKKVEKYIKAEKLYE